jgi:hypothetical protein
MMEPEVVFSAATLYDFEPDSERVRFLDQRLRSCLGQSTRYLVGELGSHIPLSPERLSSFLSGLEVGPMPPLAYALYSDLVLAIDRDDLTEAQRLLDLFLDQKPLADGLQVRELSDDLGAESSDRYIRYAEYGSELRLNLAPPSPHSARASRKKIQEAMTLLDHEDPQLASELRLLLREIILCGNGSSTKSVLFDGASNFMLWGAVLINADRSRDKVAMLQVLAHESAHNLLFGLCPDQPLVKNDARERYASPLRKDLRPLEGIYHATFVCARMHRALRHLPSSPRLSAREKAALQKTRAGHAEAFSCGMKTLDEHADLTEPGRAILESARAYMSKR